VIDYRGLAAPVGRTVGGVAVLGAVTAAASMQATAAPTRPATTSTTTGSFASIKAGTTSASTPAAISSSYTSVKLKKGAKGNAVKALQKALNKNGSSLSVDGKFGPSTLKAVKSFQKSSGLTADGVVGSATWAALSTSTSGSTSGAQSALRKGDRGEAVLALQGRLNAKGANLSLDGSFGPSTEKAVRAYQKKAGLTVDGIAGPKTMKSLTSSSSSSGSSDSSTSHPKLKKGAKGSAVKNLQKLLNKNDAGISVDGSFGPGTLTAVTAFPSTVGLTADGVVGPSTWAKLTDGKLVSIDYGSGSSDSFDGASIVSMARSYKGTPYVWGGNTTSGFDCSGLVKYVYNAHGISINRVAKDQILGGRIISQSEAKPGDLVGFTSNNYGHIGIYAGNGVIIDASSSNGRVVERSLWDDPHVFVTYR
jgi:peptidoglycan hydrolase-like protein with peptidoglycan-binding domain